MSVPDDVFNAFAISLHNATCKQPHEDRCSWYYEIHGGEHDWSGYAHREALEDARKSIAKARRLIAIYFPLANDLSPESLCSFALEVANP